MSDWREELTMRLESLRLRPEREAEIVEELAQHLDDRVRELVAAGATSEAARAAALEDLDAPGELARRLAAIEARSPYSLPPPGTPSRGRWFSSLSQDMRHSVRSLRRTPAFTLTVVAALALTIGPTTAILSVGNWLIWRPVPGVANPDRLAVVWFGEWRDRDGGTSVSPHFVSPLNLADLESSSSSITGVAGWQESSVAFAAGGVAPRHVGSAHASVNFFELVGVRPAAGRPFTPEDDLPPFGSPVAIVSDKLARGVFGGAEPAIGQAITLNGRRLSVVGVLPRGFAGATPYSNVDVWIPATTWYDVHYFSEAAMRSRSDRSDGFFYTFVMRLAPDATFDGLQAELDVLVPALAAQHPDENEAFATVRARVYPGLGPHELMRARFRRLMANLLLVGVVLIVLGCANVANLLISRGVRRQRERAVRVALGASRARLLQLLLTESCVLSVAGAVLGIAAAVWLKELIQALLLPEVAGPGAEVVVPMDLRVLATTLAIAVGCGLVAGLAPAWIGSSCRPGADLSHGDLRTSSTRARLRTGFAVTQLALSLALVTNAVLLVATLRNLGAVDLGFDPTGVSVHHLDLGSHGYDPDRAMVYNRDLLDRLSSGRAFSAVSLSSNYPFGSGHSMDLQDPNGGEEARLRVYANSVTGGYFDVLGIPILRGHVFDRSETMGAATLDGSPAIVDERLARRLFGDASALGRRIRVAGTAANEAHDLVVVGVAGNARRRSLTDEPEPMLYVPFAYDGAYASTDPVVLVRSDLPLRDVGQLVQAAAGAIDPSLPVGAAQPLTDSIARDLAGRRVFAWVLSLLGTVGFALAAVGLYGLLAQMVGERTREFGIRIAIGADRVHVFGLVLRQAVWIAVIGGGAGLGLAVLGSRVVESQLFGLSRLEPWVYAASAAALVAVVVIAAVWPARVATRIQPVEALRAE